MRGTEAFFLVSVLAIFFFQFVFYLVGNTEYTYSSFYIIGNKGNCINKIFGIKI